MKDRKFAALVAKAIKSDQKAFAKICELKVREVAYLCIRELGDSEDGRDAAQEVFIRMQTGIGDLRSAEAFNVWINRIIFSVCQDAVRKKMRRPQTAEDDSEFQDFFVEAFDELPESFIEEEEKRRVLLEIIDDLPGKYRRPLLLHYYEGLRYKEIADTLSITESAVDNNLRMARKYLRRELEERYGNDGSVLFAPSVTFLPALLAVFQKAAAAAVPDQIAKSILAGIGIKTAAAARPSTQNPANYMLASAAAVAAAAAISFTARNLPEPPGETSPEPPAQTAGTEMPKTAENGEVRVSVSGYVTLFDRELPEGLRVTVSDQSGNVAAESELGADGTIAFGELRLAESAVYTVHVEDPAGLLADDPIADSTFIVQPGE